MPETHFLTIWSSLRWCCGMLMCWQCVLCTCCVTEMFLPVQDIFLCSYVHN